jgi:hypothetical protein
MNLPLRRKARLNNMGLNIDCNVICDQCGIPRNKGKHQKCSRIRQAAGITRRAQLREQEIPE